MATPAAARSWLGYRYLVLMLTAGGTAAALAYLDAKWWGKPELAGSEAILLVAGLAGILALTLMRYRNALLTGTCGYCQAPLRLSEAACGRCGTVPPAVAVTPPSRLMVLLTAWVVVTATTVLLAQTARWLLVMTDDIPAWLADYLTLEAAMLLAGVTVVAGGMFYLRLLLTHPGLAGGDAVTWRWLLALGLTLLVLAHLPGLLTADGRARQRRVAYHNFAVRGGRPAEYAAARERELNKELAQSRGSEF